MSAEWAAHVIQSGMTTTDETEKKFRFRLLALRNQLIPGLAGAYLQNGVRWYIREM